MHASPDPSIVRLDGPWAHRDVSANGIRLHVAELGDGPVVVLLHGFAEFWWTWHHQLSALADAGFRAIAVDLRGYGDSDKPAPGPDGAEYSKRAMAADQLAVMRELGFERFAAVGHDRGARALHRLCLDAPQAVERVALLDIVPTRHAFETTDQVLASAYYHWFFLIQPAGHPERIIGADPDYWIRYHLAAWSRVPDSFDDRVVAEYRRCFDAASISATCADYRAGAGIDLLHDRADAARRIECPLAVLWGGRGFVGTHYDVLEVWRGYGTDVTGRAIDCGHFLAEEAPDATTTALAQFLG